MVYPCDAVALSSAHDITARGLARVVLYGPKSKIESVCASHSIGLQGMDIIDTEDAPRTAARCAVQAAREGSLSVLMKGSLHTDELMAEVVHRETGLRTESRISHVMVCDVPAYPKLLSLTDCVVNIAPTLEHKKHILRDAIGFLQRLGIQKPKVGIVAAVETVNPAMPATLDAKALVEFSKTAGFPDSQVEGPFGFDNVISRESARIKGMSSAVSGDADLLLLPDLQSANILYKALIYLAGGACAGVVIGARVPIVLTSRSDSVFSRLASVAVAVRSARNARI